LFAVDQHADEERGHHGAGAPALVATVRGAAIRFSDDGCSVLASAIAFNALFASFPVLILLVAGLGFVYGDAAGQARLLSLIGTLAPGIQSILVENVHQVVQFRGLSGLVAIGALLWSGKNLFQTLAYALNKAFDVEKGRPLVADIVTAIVMMPIVGILLFLATAVPIVLSFMVEYGGLLHATMISQLAGYATSIVLVFLVTMVLYRFLPNRKLGFGFCAPGAVFVTIAWEIAQVAFTLYSTHVNFRHVYGTLAAFALLLLWFNYMATIFLFGAELNAQLGFGRAT
jgi:membrane protein